MGRFDQGTEPRDSGNMLDVNFPPTTVAEQLADGGWIESGEPVGAEPPSLPNGPTHSGGGR